MGELITSAFNGWNRRKDESEELSRFLIQVNDLVDGLRLPYRLHVDVWYEPFGVRHDLLTDKQNKVRDA